MNKILCVVFAAFLLSPVVWGQEQMTPARFREIASSPGDTVSLNAKMAAAEPIFTNAIANIVIKYEDGKISKETVATTTKTVAGKYVVTTVNSELYKRPMDVISGFDEKASCYKVWGLYGETLTEGIVVYDLPKKMSSMYAAYEGGFTELGVASFSDTESSSHTSMFKNGVLIGTRDIKVTPAKPSKSK
jgi:hypothetical protein